ncbi:MAG: ClpXP protease specificity-enhancing factor SspB [Hyphomonadaceae bacterium]
MERDAQKKDRIGYQSLIQSALKSVVRAALQKAAGLGALPGEHHFYITYRTHSPGVQMADFLKDKFPEEMTIVIQHQYWDLEVFDDRFEIILQFSGVPQNLRVPFSAVTRFFDPSVNFSLQFDEGELASPPMAASAPERQPAPRVEQASGGDGTVVSFDAFRRK